ncbi:hypothetical protein F4604DRAFT_1935189 [Suillus subluteus]|nr:hypothetical protein F4604DRAFT_1935189 [Suillus subluteus]
MELPSPVTRGRGRRGGGGGGTNTQDSSPATISWHNVPMRTNKLVDYLVEHPPDCAILFATETSKKSNNYQADLGHASGKDKGEIYSVIMNHVFHNDATYGSWYATNPIKFCDSVANHITFLQNKFRDIRAKFESTGAGIVPIDSETSDNLHCKIKKDFPWYNDLYRIWGSNPSFSAKTSSSKPGAGHTSDLFVLTRPAGCSSGSPQFTNYLHPPPSIGGSSTDSPVQMAYAYLPESASPTGSTASSPLHFTHMPLPPTFSCEDYSPAPPEFNDYKPPSNDGPLADGMEDLHMDDMDNIRHDENIYNLDSPPKSKKACGKKQQLPSSPTLSPPQSVAPLPHTSNHDSRSSFKSHTNQVIMCESASSATSSSRASSGQSNPFSPQQASPTSQTLFSERVSSMELVKKHLQTEVQEQVEMLNDDLESMHSEKLALYQLKNEWLMVKLNANWQDKEHHLLHEERAHECADAALIHQRLQENKAQEIRLWEVDAKALELEREVMLLCIEYAKLNKQ